MIGQPAEIAPEFLLLEAVMERARADSRIVSRDPTVGVFSPREARLLRADGRRFLKQVQGLSEEYGDPTEAVFDVLRERQTEPPLLREEPTEEGPRVCSHCRQPRPLSEFGISSQTPDGVAYWCRQCVREKWANKDTARRRERRRETGRR